MVCFYFIIFNVSVPESRLERFWFTLSCRTPVDKCCSKALQSSVRAQTEQENKSCLESCWFSLVFFTCDAFCISSKESVSWEFAHSFSPWGRSLFHPISGSHTTCLVSIHVFSIKFHSLLIFFALRDWKSHEGRVWGFPS